MKMPFGWTTVSDSILVFYVDHNYMPSDKLQFITRLQIKLGFYWDVYDFPAIN